MGFKVTILGVPVFVSYWTILLAAILTLHGRLYIRKMMSKAKLQVSNRKLFFSALVAAIVVIASVVLHEVAHGVAAKVFDVKITQAGISWWGAFVMPEIPVNEVSPLAEMTIAVAGPFANAVIYLIGFWVVLKFGESLFENTVQFTAVYNKDMAVYNMIPFLILDGGKFMEGFMRIFFPPETAKTIGTIVNWLIVGVFVTRIFVVKRRKEKVDILETI